MYVLLVKNRCKTHKLKTHPYLEKNGISFSRLYTLFENDQQYFQSVWNFKLHCIFLDNLYNKNANVFLCVRVCETFRRVG